MFLRSATSLGQQLLNQYQVNGLIVSSNREGQTNIDSALPLALLHLESAKQGNCVPLPVFYPNNTYFDPKIVIYRQANEKRAQAKKG